MKIYYISVLQSVLNSFLFVHHFDNKLIPTSSCVAYTIECSDARATLIVRVRACYKRNKWSLCFHTNRNAFDYKLE